MDVAVICCDNATQMERLVLRDGHSIELAESIIKAQMPLAEKKKRASVFIDNTGTQDELRTNVVRVFQCASA